MTANGDDSPDRSERRSAERLEILGTLRGEVMIFEPMSVREISETGVQVETAFSLQLDSLHDLRLELGDSSVVLKGRVVHCSIADMDQECVTYRSGFEFVEPSPAILRIIARFIGDVRSGRLAR
jgi:hypothetical protein